MERGERDERMIKDTKPKYFPTNLLSHDEAIPWRYLMRVNKVQPAAWMRDEGWGRRGGGGE